MPISAAAWSSNAWRVVVGARVVVFASSLRIVKITARSLLLGFAKNERANIDADELQELRQQGRILLGLSDKQVEALVENDDLKKVDQDEANK